MAEKDMKKKFLPLVLTGGVVLADQIAKWIVSVTLPFNRPVPLLGEFLRLTYVTNRAIAFSIGRGAAEPVRVMLAIVLPLLVLAVLLYYFLAAKDITQGQRWILSAILGGGLGNQVDRIFRPRGVIDFIDLKFYGIFGLPRWPVFNLADSTVVVAGIILLITYIASSVKHKEARE